MIENKKEGKYIFGVCKVGEKGQIVIPKEARDIFDIKPGDSIIVLGDEKKGLALLKAETFYELTNMVLGDINE